MTSHFSEYVLEKFLENSIKNVFSRVSFKQFELPNLLPMTMLKNDSSVNVYCEFSDFSELLRKRLWRNPFLVN